jgi:hypothetical protein
MLQWRQCTKSVHRRATGTTDLRMPDVQHDLCQFPVARADAAAIGASSV